MKITLKDKFNWKYYLELNPDLKKNWNSPIKSRIHWALFGKREGKDPGISKEGRQYKEIIYQQLLKEESSKSKAVKENTWNYPTKNVYGVYFTCREDINLLLISLKSLERLNISFKKIFIYQDKKSPFTPEEINKIKKLRFATFYFLKTKYPNSRYGINLIANELVAYKKISRKIPEESFLAKIDSDVVFVSEDIFKNLNLSTKEFIGNPYFPKIRKGENKYVIAQGGCYFIRGSLLRRIVLTKIYPSLLETYVKNARSFLNIPEDVFFSILIKKLSKNIKFIEFHYPFEAIESKNIPNYTSYSLVHFEGKKKFMPGFWKKLTKKRLLFKYRFS